MRRPALRAVSVYRARIHRLWKSLARKFPCCLDASSNATYPGLALHDRNSRRKPVSTANKKILDVRPQEEVNKIRGGGNKYRMLIEETCQKPVTSVNICTLLTISKSPSLRQSAAMFLHNELQVRFTHQARHLAKLPMHLLVLAPIERAEQWYRAMFQRILFQLLPETSIGLVNFSDFLETILLSQKKLSWAIVEDLEALRKIGKLETSEIEILDGVLNNLLHTLIGTQFLIEHYLTIGRGGSMVDPQCSPVGVALSAAKSAKSQFSYCGSSLPPDIVVHGDAESSFSYVPSHLSVILEEVFSNSIWSIMMRNNNYDTVQPVHVYVSRGKEDVSIKVVDEGGGIKRSSLPRIWSYFYGSGCTIERGTAESDEKGLPYRKRFGKTFQGSGMGLPLARLYSCYFGGDLTVKFMEGVGTTAYIHLHAIQENCLEQPNPTVGEKKL